MKRLVPALLLMGLLCGCSGDSATDDAGKGAGSDGTPVAADSPGTDEMQSQILRTEMYKLSIELLKAKSPDRSEVEIDGVVSSMLDSELDRMQQVDPGFLMVTPAQESELKNGKSFSDVDGKLETVLKKTEEFAVDLPEPTKKLIADYKAGTLSPIRTELLAQLLDVAEKKMDRDTQ